MWQYNYTDELYHHGVLGMKWGVRKKRQTTTADKVRAKKKEYDDARNEHKRARAEKRDTSVTKKQLKDTRRAYRKEKVKINEEYASKNKFVDKYVFNPATSNRINSYMNKGETLKSARTKAYIEAGANTALALLAVGGAFAIQSHKLLR